MFSSSLWDELCFMNFTGMEKGLSNNALKQSGIMVICQALSVWSLQEAQPKEKKEGKC